MYNAHGSPFNDQHHGSTRLHLDVTSAVNIMLYAADLTDGSPGGAIWHIFPSAAQPILREFLRTESTIGIQESGDPIHNQAIYLTPTLLQLLAERHDVRPFSIHQRPGDAIFIPAGCAHQVRLPSILDVAHLNVAELQVSNMSDSIKIACDFLDVDSLMASSQLVDAFREQRLLHHWPEDVLQFEVTLWHAWTSLSKQKEHLSDNAMSMASPGSLISAMCVDTSKVLAASPPANGVGLTKQERKKEKRRLHRRQLADAQRSLSKPGHNSQCPLCPQSGYFNKRGLIHHL
jgi:hypothetical protein